MIRPGDPFVLYSAPALGEPVSGYAFGVVLSVGLGGAYVELQSRLRGEIPVAMVESGKGLLASIAEEIRA